MFRLFVHMQIRGHSQHAKSVVTDLRFALCWLSLHSTPSPERTDDCASGLVFVLMTASLAIGPQDIVISHLLRLRPSNHRDLSTERRSRSSA